MATYDWTNLLSSWSYALLTSPYARYVPSGVIRKGWLGYPPVEASDILQAEQRLQCNLPPSYQAFLAVSNGWNLYWDDMVRLWSVGEVQWSKVGRRPALLLTDSAGSAAILLDATVVNGVGEWQALRLYETDPTATYANFWELMQAEYRNLKSALSLISQNTDGATLDKLNTALGFIQQRVSLMERLFHQRTISPEQQARAQRASALLNLLAKRLEGVAAGAADDPSRLRREVQAVLRECEQPAFHQGNEEFLSLLGYCREMLG